MNSILVVEDEPAVRGLTRLMLREPGYEVLQAEDGVVAIEVLKRLRPDLVLLDILMPNVDGWGVLEFLRTMPDPPPVVIATGLRAIVAPRHLSGYITGYLIKPFEADWLLMACKTAIDQHVSRRAATPQKEGWTFGAEATLLSGAGAPIAKGKLQHIYARRFHLEIAVPLTMNDPVDLLVRLRGRAEPLRLSGIISSRNEMVVGVEIENLSAEDEALLRERIAE